MNTNPTVPVEAAETNGPLALLLWALLTADVCVHEADHVLLTWDREAGGTMQIRVPTDAHLPDFRSPDLTAALTSISHLRDLDAADDETGPEEPRTAAH